MTPGSQLPRDCSEVEQGVEYLRLEELDATLPTLIAARQRLVEFVGSLQLRQDACADIVLASYEALANAVEHAYAPGDQGTLDLYADHNRIDDILTVTVVDHGSWKPGEQDPLTRRGQGLKLIRACCDTVILEPRYQGTQIRLQWNCGTRRDRCPNENSRPIVDPDHPAFGNPDA